MKRRGFTLIEVMISLVVIGVGSAALFQLQGVVARSNLLARQITNANEVLSTWVERLKADAVYWTASGAPDNTIYLTDIGNNAGVWLPAGGGNNLGFLGQYPAFNTIGDDVNTQNNINQSSIAYCASYRFSWVVVNELIRADVRVYWPRDGIPANASLANAFALCAGGNLNQLDPGGLMAQYYHVLYASTVLRWNPQPVPPP